MASFYTVLSHTHFPHSYDKFDDAVTGGYCKEYIKGKRPIGVMLDDTWFLKYAHTFLLFLVFLDLQL
jgi:hypothetical protein